MTDLSPEHHNTALLNAIATALSFRGASLDQLPAFVVDLVQGLRRERDAARAALRASEAERAPLLDALTACNERNAALEAADAAQRTEIEALRRQLDIAQGALNSTTPKD